MYLCTSKLDFCVHTMAFSIAEYQINLLNIRKESKTFEFKMEDEFFEAMESMDVNGGSVQATVTVNVLADESFQFLFHIEGVVQVSCDRCLENMDLPISTDNMLIVKQGSYYMEEDDILTIPENENEVDVASYLNQFILLNIPIKHVHAPGKCNTQMIEVLNQHLAIRSGIEDETAENEENGDNEDNGNVVDPRWSELMKLKE